MFSCHLRTNQLNCQFLSPTLSQSSTTFVSKLCTSRPTTSVTNCSRSLRNLLTWKKTTSWKAQWTPLRSLCSPRLSSQSFFRTISKKRTSGKWSKAQPLTSRWSETPCTSTARRPRNVISQTHASLTSSSSSLRASRVRTTSRANLEILDKIWMTK